MGDGQKEEWEEEKELCFNGWGLKIDLGVSGKQMRRS